MIGKEYARVLPDPYCLISRSGRLEILGELTVSATPTTSLPANPTGRALP